MPAVMGFGAGLVPGMSVFAYMSRPLVDLMEKDWLERGSAEVHFLRPLYAGEEIRVGGSVSNVAGDGTLSLDYRASTNQGVTCGVGVAKLPPSAPPLSHQSMIIRPAAQNSIVSSPSSLPQSENISLRCPQLSPGISIGSTPGKPFGTIILFTKGLCIRAGW